jgi:hypothetical protein
MTDEDKRSWLWLPWVAAAITFILALFLHYFAYLDDRSIPLFMPLVYQLYSVTAILILRLVFSTDGTKDRAALILVFVLVFLVLFVLLQKFSWIKNFGRIAVEVNRFLIIAVALLAGVITTTHNPREKNSPAESRTIEKNENVSDAKK